jgi:hypothetical protein
VAVPRVEEDPVAVRLHDRHLVRPLEAAREAGPVATVERRAMDVDLAVTVLVANRDASAS